MRVLFMCAAIVIALSGCGGEQSESVTREAVSSPPLLIVGVPGEVGMSPKRLADAVGVFRRAVEDGRVTGVQLLVARNDKVVVDEALGWRDLEKRLPMERNTLVLHHRELLGDLARLAYETAPGVTPRYLVWFYRRSLSKLENAGLRPAKP